MTPKKVFLFSIDFGIRILSTIAIANVLLISVLVVYIEKDMDSLPPLIAQLGLPATLGLGFLLVFLCVYPEWIFKKLKLDNTLGWVLSRAPALIVTSAAIWLFLIGG